MRYFVTGEDGNRYGPADEGQLRAWASQGRITPNTLLEPEHGGPKVTANTMPGLQFPPATAPYMPTPNPYGQPYGYGNPVRFATKTGWAAWEMQLAWGLAIAAAAFMLICGSGGFFGALGIVASVIAMMRGHRAFGPLLLSIAVVVFQVLLVNMIGR